MIMMFFQIDEDIKKIELNKIEIECINRVYDHLSRQPTIKTNLI